MTGELRTFQRWSRELFLAQIQARLGRTCEAVNPIQTLLRVPSPLTVPTLRVSPDWDGLREDRGFKALLADPKNSALL